MPPADAISAAAPRWPGGAKFALFLSHDVDKIRDRELFYVLAAINHIRRRAMHGEPGSVRLALRRLARALVAPKPPEMDFQTILAIEARHGFRSTFFVLHDVGWRRRGSRYALTDPALRRIVGMIRAAGGEIGLHGGYYRLNQAAAYRESRELLRRELGVEAVGIRNHFLRHTGAETWQAQEQAGFRYDSTFGFSDRVGARDARVLPFFPLAPGAGEPSGILELPLTVMDVALFMKHGPDGRAALAAAWAAIEPVVAAGGLVTLLWHNDCFNEPEYREWQWTYERLLERLAALAPWCATGAEIHDWWRGRAENGALDGKTEPL
ncbi:MAG TPA: hypothetical protein P5204_01395 [Kiritimatiellia bacterium]|nr:hypothetical protein [Kiritimatiellia bacterium]